MTIEIPIFKLGLAGFTLEQQGAVAQVLLSGTGELTAWELGELEDADAWWVYGPRTQSLGDQRLRVVPGVPTGRALQLYLPDIDRPLAFATPLPRSFHALCSFDLEDPATMVAAIAQFDTWLAPVVAQFLLAAHVVEHETALGSGRYELGNGAGLLAVVDMRGEVAVKATARPADFEDAAWIRSTRVAVPEDFASTTLGQLMWQYAVRTQHDVLPPHYRTGLLYFRRAPRVAQRLTKDTHLLLMRELMLAPATFAQLQERCELGEDVLARSLAALYFAGSITSNPKRAAKAAQVESSMRSMLPSGLGAAGLAPDAPPGVPPADLTAPAPIGPDH